MKTSFFCNHCGEHLRRGDHRECKRILRREEADRVKREREIELARKSSCKKSGF